MRIKASSFREMTNWYFAVKSKWIKYMPRYKGVSERIAKKGAWVESVIRSIKTLSAFSNLYPGYIKWTMDKFNKPETLSRYYLLVACMLAIIGPWLLIPSSTVCWWGNV